MEANICNFDILMIFFSKILVFLILFIVTGKTDIHESKEKYSSA